MSVGTEMFLAAPGEMLFVTKQTWIYDCDDCRCARHCLHQGQLVTVLYSCRNWIMCLVADGRIGWLPLENTCLTRVRDWVIVYGHSKL